MSTAKKKVTKSNHERFLEALEINELSLPEMAEIIGYSAETLRGFSMPDRTSTRARPVTDRFIEFMNMKLLANGKQEV